MNSNRLFIGLCILFILLINSSALADFYMKVEADGSIIYTNIPTTSGFKMIYDELEEEYFTYEEYYYTTDMYDDIINNASIIYGVEPALIKSVIKTESNFDPYAVSNKGACGLMQLIPETAERFNVEDVFDPKSNIYGGVEYLSYLIILFKGDTKLAVAAYNAGENAVIKYNEQVPPYKETKNYVKKVFEFLEYYRDRPLSL